MTDSVLIGIVCAIVLVSVIVAFTVIVSRLAERQSLLIASLIAQHDRQVDKLLDRLAAIRWEDYASLRATLDDTEEGGFESGEDEEEEAEPAVRWGALRNGDTSDQLAMEDFGQ